ncbi:MULTISPECIES: hypothetical protein [Acinetobacter]|jgi:hypothetical protein|uniref:hypothetical protein n=1 Tax=Acinetobacter TaxID=469 RepID=UPI00044CF0D3|nr:MULTISPECIES: hypothetical protein [Acinetobacter]EXB30454.1 hypothetical protein J546_2961 [Acinetobacter sp. 1461402]EXB69867.1 hypothetical protein J550_2595 [Acinetobacter sp. 230853]KCX36440.1 hypothetical protein J577_2409 [Acinetobacter sp. 263903-1]MDP1443833.1 hypothetical protein [Acinetobacter schindleri]WGX72403.1 hypothetical protein QJS67_08680 [Acinetobacter radioresistens]
MKVTVLTLNEYFEVYTECEITGELTSNTSIVFTAVHHGEKVILINTAFESYLIQSTS